MIKLTEIERWSINWALSRRNAEEAIAEVVEQIITQRVYTIADDVADYMYEMPYWHDATDVVSPKRIDADVDSVSTDLNYIILNGPVTITHPRGVNNDK